LLFRAQYGELGLSLLKLLAALVGQLSPSTLVLGRHTEF
jgi:hypothetical protein